MTPQSVDTTSEVVTKLQILPPEQKQQVLDFVEFLASKYSQEASDKSKNKKRIAGLHEGKGWTTEDFNEPLPDEFWMGE